MKYLMTGGCGFIGSHLCESLLKGGHEVVVLDDLSTGKLSNISSEVEFVEGSVCNKAKLAKLLSDVDGCFHLAAIASVERSSLEWEYSHEVNVGGTVNLLAAISRLSKKIPIVFASSAAVYGDAEQMPIDELTPVNPLTAYGADKLGSEYHAKVGFLVHEIPYVGLRFFNVYGERQDPSSPYSGVISIFSDKISKGEDITIFGDGMQSRDFVYVKDVVSAICAAMSGLENKKISNEIICVCTGREVTLLDLAETVEGVTGNQVAKSFEPKRVGDIKHSLGNPRLMNELLGVVANTTLKDGIKRIIQEVS